MSAGELGAVDPSRLAVTHKRILDDVMPGVATARPQRDEHAANPCSSNPNPNPNPKPKPKPKPNPNPNPNQADLLRLAQQALKWRRPDAAKREQAS